MFDQSAKRIILASASKSRANLLKNAGVEVETMPADIDEKSVRIAMDGQEPADIAEILARLKAEAISAAHPNAVVIGADQVLACEGEIYEKPEDMEAARQTLLNLRGQTHELISAVAIAEHGATNWTHTETAKLTMRDITPEFIGRYLAAAGDDVLNSVGAYQLEGLGVQLFSKVNGDFFTILGLPLIPLLTTLREKELIPT